MMTVENASGTIAVTESEVTVATASATAVDPADVMTVVNGLAAIGRESTIAGTRETAALGRIEILVATGIPPSERAASKIRIDTSRERPLTMTKMLAVR